ncbi:MAG TPA: LamG domain-containing protein, partial [Thermoplasmata archaeon]|nr:LamG domain-containing protein [Thermoplasmata archaeon]
MKKHKRNVMSLLIKRGLHLRGHDTRGVSEIIATILLLSISLALLCVVYLLVLNNATAPSSTLQVSSAQLLATADETNVYLQNNGGHGLPSYTKLIISIGGTDFYATVADCILDTNGDGQWSIGEEILFTPPGVPSLFGLEIQIKIINPDTNSMIMAGLVQEGAKGDFPYAQTLNPYDVWPHSATLKMYYNFVKTNFLPGKVWFQWKRSDDTFWTKTSAYNVTIAPLSGYQTLTLYNLTSNKNYLYEAWIEYSAGNTTFNQSGGIKLFTTQIDAMGIWHFDELSGLKVFDSSGQYPPNDGALKPNEPRGPQRVNTQLNHSIKNVYMDGIDDLIEVPNSNTLSVTNECTIETWINRSAYSDGLVGIPVQSSLVQFGNYTLGCNDPCLLNTNSNFFALVSTNENSYGYLSILNISSTGDIIENKSTSSCILDLFNFDTSCRNPKIIQVSGISGIYAIVYSRPASGNQLYVKTVQIYDDGRINKVPIGTRALDTNISASPDIIKIDFNTYGIVYSITAANTGVLISLDISLVGVISPVSNKLVFGDIMIEPEIIKIVDSLDNYVIVYNCIGDDGGIRTVKITNGGALSDISYHVWYDDDDGGNPEIINVHDDVYAIVYAGPILRQSCVLKTIEILPTGSITLSRTIPPLAGAISQISIDFIANMTVRHPHILPLFGVNDFFGISFSIDSSTSNLWGKIVTIMIQDNGNIVAISKKDVIFEPFMCATSYFIPLSFVNELYAIVYRSESNDGVIKTIEVGNDGHVHNNPIKDLAEIGGLKSYVNAETLTSDKQYVINVYRGVNAQIMVKTVKVSTATKTIAQTFTDSKIIELGYTSSNGTFNASYAPIIIPIKNDVYAIAYCHYMTVPMFHHGRIVTIQVNATGCISIIERYTFDNNLMNNPFLFTPINKTNGFYAAAYQLYSTSQGKIATIKIGDNGHIFGVVDSWVFEAVRCRESSMVSVGGDVYAIMYRDSLTPSNYGKIVTLKIYGTNGTIKKSLIDFWQFTTSCYHPSIVKVGTDIFAGVFVYYDGGGSRYIAYVASVKIASNGVISKAWIDSLEFIRRYYTDNYMCQQPEIFHVGNRVYAIISKDLPDPWNNYVYNGYITSLRIGENGDIIDTVDGSIQISTSPRITSYDMKIIPFVNDSYIAIYGGKNNDLYQCVIRIPLIGTNQTIFSKQNSYSIKANKTKVFVTFTDSNNNLYTLSANLTSNWNYIVSTYDRTTMNLYVNAILQSSKTLGSKPV